MGQGDVAHPSQSMIRLIGGLDAASIRRDHYLGPRTPNRLPNLWSARPSAPSHPAQARRGRLRRDIALRRRQHFVAHQELAHRGRAQ